ncbi:MAG: glycosyltransferase involved in cell wall biosynthesis [Patiriisocius sp.]|jgi:glycosyltransferase involved in cell wall biosynthesis
MKKYSVIVPVYNRPSEVDELLGSLQSQTLKDFEIVIIEDGSTEDCKSIIAKYPDLEVNYFFKDNSGPGDSRNVGMTKAKGLWMIFFDSDCVIPEAYFQSVEDHLQINSLDTFGGPDAAHESFTTIQKAINYAMTSILTTGGVRGKENKLDQYQPRTFNMGIKREVFEKVGGFSDVHPGEDPDWSYRIMNAGYKVGLIESAYVYHKRRIDFKKFLKQVYKFGVARTILIKWYPDKFKPTYLLPTLFLLGSIGLVICGVLLSKFFISPLLFLVIVLFIDALMKTKSLLITLLAVPASFAQLYGYGYGFLKGWINIHILRREERKAFPSFFFKK